jgi:hypothetical protein
MELGSSGGGKTLHKDKKGQHSSPSSEKVVGSATKNLLQQYAAQIHN